MQLADVHPDRYYARYVPGNLELQKVLVRGIERRRDQPDTQAVRVELMHRFELHDGSWGFGFVRGPFGDPLLDATELVGEWTDALTADPYLPSPEQLTATAAVAAGTSPVGLLLDGQ